MKKIYTIGLVALSMFTASCQSKLDSIKPTGSLLDDEQVSQGAELSTDRANGGITAMYAQLTAREGVFRMQGDFGYPSFACRLEHGGDNVVSTTSGFNWFQAQLKLNFWNNKRGFQSVWAWNATYKNIKLANDIIMSFTPKEGEEVRESLKPVLGQAHAMRAWDYFFLAQLFQKTYYGHEDMPCVPLVTEKTTTEEYADNPRKTNREIYKFIQDELAIAIDYLEGASVSSKSQISQGVAYGIRCRVNMVMHNWEQAAKDAKLAIQVSGATPFTIADCSIPNFDDVQEAQNSMWGIIITDKDGVSMSGIANFTSMFTSLNFGAGGYCVWVGAYKKLNSRVWNKISDTDIRKEWYVHPQKVNFGWTDENGKPVLTDICTSKLIENAYMKSNKLEKGNDWAYVGLNLAEHPYAVVKFAPTNKDISCKINATDFFLMRVEEMYYNLAESLAMAGNLEAGTQVLNQFVKTYRDPGYDKTFASAEELQDEVYFQKRFEFFGEGISWFDMVRMNKGIDRVDVATKDDGGYPATTRINVPAGSDLFVLQIPLSEEQTNKAVEGNNNPLCPDPVDAF